MAPKEWLIVVPDHPNALSKRMEVRPKHFEGLKPNITNGKIVAGGATLERHPEEGEEGPGPLNGSALIVVAESEEEAMSLVKSDIYAESGVWNVEKVQIWPFKSAVRKEL